jgi:hypothetical protein
LRKQDTERVAYLKALEDVKAKIKSSNFVNDWVLLNVVESVRIAYESEE